MKKTYEALQIELILLDPVDVLTASDTSDGFFGAEQDLTQNQTP